MEFLTLHAYVLLKHILNRDHFKAARPPERAPLAGEGLGSSAGAGASAKLKRPRTGKELKQLFLNNERLIDFEGPKLITGLRSWLVYYQAVGVINLDKRPLYVSVLFKLVLLSMVLYRMSLKVWHLYSYQVVDRNYRNPIFVFINMLSVTALGAQFIATTRLNLLNLCPLFKVLTTPKLCFLKTEALEIMGSKGLRAAIMFNLYQSTLLYLVECKDWHDFVSNFNVVGFVFEIYVVNIWTSYQIGMSQLDFYVRSAFSQWLLALKSHLEHQFTYLHELHAGETPPELEPHKELQQAEPDASSASAPIRSSVRPCDRFVSFDEIQRSLNNMDDHLEVLRSVQISSLVFASLNAFLSNGALILLGYHVLVNQSNYFHGIILLLVTLNFMIITFITYSGDSFLYYSLSSLVQAVEDEYFTESQKRVSWQMARPSAGQQADFAANSSQEAGLNRLAASAALARLHHEKRASDASLKPLAEQHYTLLIKRKDVLFCREFLHQFEHHLATPWSRLTLKSHLHIVRTFVTLIAAQVIFDHEH